MDLHNIIKIVPTKFTNSLGIVILILLSNISVANYSPVYDTELEKLTQTNPEKALIIASQRLDETHINTEKLKALYYIADSHHMMDNYVELKMTTNKGLKLAQKINNKRYIFEFNSYKVFLYELNGKLIEALIHANKNLTRALEINDQRLIASALSIRGQMQLNLGNHQSALHSVEESITLFRRHNDLSNLSNSFNLIAIIYADINDFENSIKFYKESLSIKSDNHASFDTSTVYYNIGSSYLELEQYDTALEYYKKTIDHATIHNDISSIYFAKAGIADTYFMQDKYNQAIEIYLQIIKHFQKVNDVQMIFNINLYLAQIYIDTKHFDKANYYLSQADKTSQTLNNKISKINVLKIKDSYYQTQNRWSDAHRSLNEIMALNDQLHQLNKSEIIEELKIKFNARFDQEKLDLLQHQNKLQQDLILQGKLRNKYLSIIITLTAISLMAMFVAYRTQKRQRKYLYTISRTDSLTNAYNRRYIIEYLKKCLRHTKKKRIANNNLTHNAVMVDLDYFKNINDTYGHEIGNKVLIHFTQTVIKNIKPSGKLARIGGEEWLIIINNLSKQKMIKLLEVIRNEFTNASDSIVPKESKINFSSGVLLNIEKYHNYDDILNDVDKALYRAKNTGRAKDCFFDDFND